MQKKESKLTYRDINNELDRLKKLLDMSVKTLDFESAIKIRDRMKELRESLNN